MQGYLDDPEQTAVAMRGGYYHTGDRRGRDADGYLTYVGRSDDVFKSSDYRISPFELESVLIEHPAVAEAAVVPSPDPLRLSVPKAFVVLAGAAPPDARPALSIFVHLRARVSPYKRVRRLEFADAAEDDLRQDPPRRAAPRSRPAAPIRQRGAAGRILGGGLPRPQVRRAGLNAAVRPMPSSAAPIVRFRSTGGVAAAADAVAAGAGDAALTVLFASAHYGLADLGLALAARGVTRAIGAATGRVIGAHGVEAHGVTGFHLPAGRFAVAETLIEDAAALSLPEARERVAGTAGDARAQRGCGLRPPLRAPPGRCRDALRGATRGDARHGALGRAARRRLGRGPLLQPARPRPGRGSAALPRPRLPQRGVTCVSSRRRRRSPPTATTTT